MSKSKEQMIGVHISVTNHWRVHQNPSNSLISWKVRRTRAHEEWEAVHSCSGGQVTSWGPQGEGTLKESGSMAAIPFGSYHWGGPVTVPADFRS